MEIMDKFDDRQKEFSYMLLRKEDLRQLWHPELEIIFMLKGTGKIYFTDVKTEYTVRETDMFVINCFEMQNFELEKNALALSLTVSVEFLMSVNPELLKYQVNCRSFLHDENKQEPFDALRREFAIAFEEQYKRADLSGKHFKSKTVAVLEDLSRYFLDRKKPVENRRGIESLRAAINYIQLHYKENVTLDDLAAETFLSKTYISRCFTKYFGISFTDYVMLLRLSDAAKRMHGKCTLAEIAYESGFPNVNSMIHAFKQQRGITPGEYRKRILQNENGVQFNADKNGEEAREDFSSLMKYAKRIVQSESAAENMTSIVVDMKGRKKRISLHWKRIMNVGYARNLADGVIQEEIRYLQEKIGFEYIRIKGILDDDMCLLRTDMNGNTIMNYAYVEEVIDFILSVGAKPMMELGFMPDILAKESAFHSMRAESYSIPKSYEQWYGLIKSLIGHFAEHYGNETVRKWLFSPWIPPDFMEFGLCLPEEYEETYMASYSAIKSVNPDFLIAGPGSTEPQNYLKWYLEMCRRRNCIPDIITFRSFAAARAEEKDQLNLIGNNESISIAVSEDENLIRNLAEEIREVLRKEGLPNIPIVLEEWSNNVWQRDLCNDTCYKSAYLFKNVLENNSGLNAMGYFTLNDRIDEVPPAKDSFCGGFGLFTKNDIPKSACRALELLGQMGDRLLEKGDGYFITRREGEI